VLNADVQLFFRQTSVEKGGKAWNSAIERLLDFTK
jgi:hypothetical protein